MGQICALGNAGYKIIILQENRGKLKLSVIWCFEGHGMALDCSGLLEKSSFTAEPK